MDDKLKSIVRYIYEDPKLGLTVNNTILNLKKKGIYFNESDVKKYLKSFEVNQVMSSQNNSYNSFVAEGPLEQFQIDLIYMPKSWWNKRYKYILTCVDVFSKVADMRPLKLKDDVTTTTAMLAILKNMGNPETIYSDQGAEFNNDVFLSMLKKRNIKIIFTQNHARFIESFNRTMKNRLYKYMEIKDDAKWYDVLDDILFSYNNTPHSATGFAPVDVSEENAGIIRMRLHKRAKRKVYEDIMEGDKVRIPIKQVVKKGYKQQWTYTKKAVDESLNNGLYLIDGKLYPRRDLMKVDEENLVKREEKPKRVRKIEKEVDKLGKAENSVEVRDLLGDVDMEQVRKIINEPARVTRSKAKRK